MRLAKNVLQKVVRKYLQRNSLLIASIQKLARLAERGSEALARGDLQSLGEIILRVWGIHQEMDPLCTNSQVEAIFQRVHSLCFGYKLLGAGGGGFAVLVAKSGECAGEIRRVLGELGEPIKVFDWSLWEGESLEN